jgi:hypothetical protein
VGGPVEGLGSKLGAAVSEPYGAASALSSTAHGARLAPAKLP